MSHFSVLCIGDVSSNMERFREQDENFFEYVDRLEVNKADYEKHKTSPKFLEEYPDGTFAEFVKWWRDYDIIGEGEEPKGNGFVRVDKDGNVIERCAFFNPDSKYDYCDMGHNAFVLKDGTETYKAVKKDIDFAKMNEIHEKEMREDYRMARKCVKTFEEGATAWGDFAKRIMSGELTHDKAQELYDNQPCIKEYEKNKIKVYGNWWFGRDFDIVDFNCTEDEYVVKNPISLCRAVVKDGKWYERGQMGWWGMSSNDMPLGEWSKNVWELINSIDDEEELTMLNCHI